MVRAILAGQKTQTRRAFNDKANWHFVEGQGDPSICPYGQPGDRLWVRESFMDVLGTGIEHRDTEGRLRRYAYAADSPPGSYSDETRKDYGLKWKPSIHMPRVASRITLEITGVRVERLLDISEADCIAEGAPGGHGSIPGYPYNATPDEHFKWIWESVGGDWAANPWVWVVEFQRMES